MKNNKEELVKLIQENPNLPLVFFTDNDTVAYDYGTTFRTDYRCYISEIYVTDELIYDEFDSVCEAYRNLFCDEQEYENLSDKEFDKAVEEYVEKEIEHYKAIVVYVD